MAIGTLDKSSEVASRRCLQSNQLLRIQRNHTCWSKGMRDHEPGSAHCVRPVIMSICLTVICGCFVTNNVTVSPLHINNFMKNNFSGPTVGLLSSSWRLRVAQSLRCIILSGSFHKLCHPLVSSVDSVVACMSWDTDVFALRETKLSDWNTIRFISLKYNFKK